MNTEKTATVIAGIPSKNMTLYHRIQFGVGDPAAWIGWVDGKDEKSLLILRDIEMERARHHARVGTVACPADFTPDGGLSGNREEATAQALAEALHQKGFSQVVADRSLPLVFAEEIRRRNISIECDLAIGITDRRRKDASEIAALRASQEATETAMRLACEMVAQADVDGEGNLLHKGSPLTSECVRSAIDIHLSQAGFSTPQSIVAGGADGGDCHNLGSGVLRTGEPVIIDIFPRDVRTLYNGDCTRTVVHGTISKELEKMHDAVIEAKSAAEAATRAGVTAESVHAATIEVIRRHGFGVGIDESERCAMVHGTGHGIGLEVHEPPLLDVGVTDILVPGDALTIEPGLYSKAIGGIRVEDMVIVTENGCENLNQLPEDLAWA